MAKVKMGKGGIQLIDSTPKMSRQGQGNNTKYSATSRNNAEEIQRSREVMVTN